MAQVVRGAYQKHRAFGKRVGFAETRAPAAKAYAKLPWRRLRRCSQKATNVLTQRVRFAHVPIPATKACIMLPWQRLCRVLAKSIEYLKNRTGFASFASSGCERLRDAFLATPVRGAQNKLNADKTRWIRVLANPGCKGLRDASFADAILFPKKRGDETDLVSLVCVSRLPWLMRRCLGKRCVERSQANFDINQASLFHLSSVSSQLPLASHEGLMSNSCTPL